MPASARDLAGDALLACERQGTRIRDSLERLRSTPLAGRERGLLTELAYGVVRTQGTLDVCLSAFSRRALERLDPATRVALRLGLYQCLYLSRVPAAAAVDHAVQWVRRGAGAWVGGFVNGVLRAALRALEGPAQGPEDARRDVPREDGSALRWRDPLFPDLALAPAANLGARYAMPDWLVARWLARLGREGTLALLRTQLARPGLTLRVRRGDPAALCAALAAQDPAARPGPVRRSILLPGGEGRALDLVERGEAAVQDATAQRVAPLLEPHPGQRLLDLCAAPGGKALHLVDLLGGEGEVVAADVDPRKVEALAALATRVPPGVRWTPALVPAVGALPFEPQSFDGILVDAPCSNTGVLRRRVEARWRLKPGDPAALAAIQLALLRRALPLLRPAGRLVYATCSLEPEENGGVRAALLADRPDLSARVAFDVLPTADADGGFACVVEFAARVGTTSPP